MILALQPITDEVSRTNGIYWNIQGQCYLSNYNELTQKVLISSIKVNFAVFLINGLKKKDY